jgi:hypothetical protein
MYVCTHHYTPLTDTQFYWTVASFLIIWQQYNYKVTIGGMFDIGVISEWLRVRGSLANIPKSGVEAESPLKVSHFFQDFTSICLLWNM